MKGFLQRVAASAIRTAPRIHPLVAPMYAANDGAEQFAPMGHFESSTLSTSSQPRAGNPSAFDSSDGRARTSENLVAPNTSHRNLSSSVGAKENFELPMSRPPVADSATGAFPVDQYLSAAASRNGSPVETDADSMAELDGGERRNGGRAWGLEDLPLIVERLLDSRTEEARQLPYLPEAMQSQPLRKDSEVMKVAAQANSRRQTAQAQSAVAAQVRKEEVQIHIGRIEVLAMPQAAPRSVAAPVRKGLSLDEYLSRRNGRTV